MSDALKKPMGRPLHGKNKPKLFDNRWPPVWALLSAGASQKAAAQHVGVDPRTIIGWRKNPHYVEGLEIARKLYARQQAKACVENLGDVTPGRPRAKPVNLYDKLTRRSS